MFCDAQCAIWIMDSNVVKLHMILCVKYLYPSPFNHLDISHINSNYIPNRKYILDIEKCTHKYFTNKLQLGKSRSVAIKVESSRVDT